MRFKTAANFLSTRWLGSLFVNVRKNCLKMSNFITAVDKS
jgi:hypothetical protein